MRQTSTQWSIPIGLLGCASRTILFTVAVVIVSAIVLVPIAAAYMYDVDPDGYADILDQVSGSSSTYTLQNPEKAVEVGVDPGQTANDLAAIEWVNSRGGQIDLGIMVSIREHESGNGSNLGRPGGLSNACNFSAQECAAAKELLQRMKEYEARDWSEVARETISEDYTDFVGHGAGEMGPDGILPSTGLRICEVLREHEDRKIQSCNFFDPVVSTFAKATWLDMIGYQSSQTDDAKVIELYGWNRDEAYRKRLVARAAEVNDEEGVSSLLFASSETLLPANYVTDGLVLYLDVFDLLPPGFTKPGSVFTGDVVVKGPDAFRLPYDEGEYSITQGEHDGNRSVDLKAGHGAEVKSPINGVVTEIFTDGLGNTAVRIKNQRYTVTILHGDYHVEVGDELKIGEPIGTESNNGNTRGTVDGVVIQCNNRPGCGDHTHITVFDNEENVFLNAFNLATPVDSSNKR